MIKRGDIWLADFGAVAVGSEQSGVRPVVIVQNDKGNEYAPTTLVCPLTSRHKKPLPTHVLIGTENGIAFLSVCICEQSRVVDKTRLLKYIGKIKSPDTMAAINKRVAIAFGLV